MSWLYDAPLCLEHPRRVGAAPHRAYTDYNFKYTMVGEMKYKENAGEKSPRATAEVSPRHIVSSCRAEEAKCRSETSATAAWDTFCIGILGLHAGGLMAFENIFECPLYIGSWVLWTNILLFYIIVLFIDSWFYPASIKFPALCFKRLLAQPLGLVT